MNRVRNWTIALTLVLAAGMSLSGAEPAEAIAGWTALTGLNADAALRAFANPSVAPREARFGRAVALLAKQPTLPEQIEDARRTFADLATGDDEIAAGSRYFLGRVAQHHLETPDVAEATKQYRQLIAEHPASIWAQTALTRLALLELYPEDPAIPPETRVANAAKLLDAARQPMAQSELHLVIADAIFYYRLPVAGALPHLLAAEKLGQVEGPARADVLIQIAEVSLLENLRDQARSFYQKFLEEYPLDQRQFMVKERLRLNGLAAQD